MNVAINLKDGENLQFTSTPQFVDELNAEFYGRFPYPWPPSKFRRLREPDFETVMHNQNLGDWDHRSLPASPRIWVAGCGTNQALLTALRFPHARVVGSDISRTSLEICSGNARQLNVSNLELRRESLNQVEYADEFDYVISTGVIHHNAEPRVVLKNLVRAMKPRAFLELMVYNKGLWTLPANFQRALRLLCGHADRPEFNTELAVARALVNGFPVKNSVGRYVSQFDGCPESMFADALLQPVLHGYTIESFEALAHECELELLHPHVSMFDKSARTLTWNMQFAGRDLQERYDLLPDLDRWKISNLLLWEQSPMLLWFYFQRRDSGRPRRSEAEICEQFLQRRFVRAETKASYFVRTEAGYALSSDEEAYPSFTPEAPARRVLEVVDGKQPMRDVLRQCDIDLSFTTVNRMRIALATSEFPFLRCSG